MKCIFNIKNIFFLIEYLSCSKYKFLFVIVIFFLKTYSIDNDIRSLRLAYLIFRRILLSCGGKETKEGIRKKA